MVLHDETGAAADRDAADLAKFGYKQELRRSLGVFSSFAVAFSYISPSTGIFALFFLGLTTVGGVFIWSWPIVAIGQLIVALGFAELSSHYPVAGSVFQWTKYLAGKTYSWFTGWIYLFAGILTVASVCATLPLALIPAFNNMGWNLANNHSNQRIIAVITLVRSRCSTSSASGSSRSSTTPASCSRSSAWSCSRSSSRSSTTTKARESSSTPAARASRPGRSSSRCSCRCT